MSTYGSHTDPALLAAPRPKRRPRFPGGVGLAALVVGALLLVLAAPAFGQEIFVVRPANNNKSIVYQPQITLEVEVAAFSPLTQVKIGGASQPVNNATSVVVKKTIKLKPGKNSIVVVASTNSEEVTKEFIIQYLLDRKDTGAEPEEAKKPLTLFGSVGSQYASNFSRDDTSTFGLRTFLVFVPMYDMHLVKDTTLRFQGIITREKYNRPQLSVREILLNQASAQWIVGDPEKQNWSVSGGFNSLEQEFKDFGNGMRRVEQDLFLGATMRRAGPQDSFFQVGLNLKEQNFEYEGDTNYDPNATLVALSGDYFGKVAGIPTVGAVNLAFNNATGRFKDNTTLRMRGMVNYPLFGMVLGGVAKVTHRMFDNPDPARLIKPVETLTGLSGSVAYPLYKSLGLAVEVLTETQASNVRTSFSNNALTAALTYVY